MAAPASNVVVVSRSRLKEARIQRLEFSNTVWAVSVETGVPFEEVLKPEFWAHVVRPKNMKIGDYLNVTPDDNSWWAQLIVRDCGAVWAKVGLLNKVEFEKQSATGDDKADVSVQGFKVEWQGLANKHVVIRERDGAIVAKGFKTKPEAQIAMIEHARSVGA